MAITLLQIHDVSNDTTLLKWIAGGLVAVAKAKAGASPTEAEQALCNQILGASDLLPMARAAARALLGEFYNTGSLNIVDDQLTFGENVDDEAVIGVINNIWQLLVAGSN